MDGMSIRKAEVIAKGTLIVYISINFYIVLYGRMRQDFSAMWRI
jgi:hypothetical protein